jgi:hypothetical protein
MCKYRAYFCKSEKRAQKGEDGRKKTKELALQSFWRVKKSELEENARVRSWKDGEGSLEPVEAAEQMSWSATVTQA